ncbi:hypothetical protein AGDE_13751 [Angomonas deanei]|nr:hypothetical protein AGDE_13751 [Angomonas deanei]|eukprot:EPY21850.1 hypothetical protein AGDE_13751 [Angomonas deanei]
MQHARKSRDDSLPSHTTYLRIANHPKWKNMSFMLAVEKGRLVFYGSASSRVTQEEWLRRASELAVPLTWIAGGVFVMEERAMGVTDVNSVYVACEVLLNFPLLPPPEDGEDALMEGFSVALYSTFPFNGAQTHVPRLRCVLTGEGRSTWSLKGPTPLHGRLLQAVVACLVERTDVSQFHLYSDADEPEGGETKDRPGVAAEAGAVTFLRGRAGTHTVPHGKGCSSQMWYGFSRLSCQEWLDTETRDALGLWEEDGEEELECEFVPAHIFFTRAADRKRPRDTDDDHSSSSVAARWGKCFMIECKVMRIIDPEQVEETQGA